MKAITFHGTGDVRTEVVPDPEITDSSSAIIRITTSAICGSDLHQYLGRTKIEPGVVMGHEMVGVVEEAGSEVTRIKPGDRVVAPFNVSCGQCTWCLVRLPSQCASTGRAVFGGRFGKQYPGAQASFLRVPFADFMCEKIPSELSDEDAIFLGDILSTGYACAENGNIKRGDTVAVFGCGPVGLLALQCVYLFEPSRVLAVDRVDYRLRLAEQLGAIPLNLDDRDPIESLKMETQNRGPDVVLECVGHPLSFTQAILAVRPGGTVSSAGVYVEDSIAFPAREAFFKGLTLKMGICNARNYIKLLMSLVHAGKLQPRTIISHLLPLDDGAHGYKIFDKKEDRAIKVLLKP